MPAILTWPEDFWKDALRAVEVPCRAALSLPKGIRCDFYPVLMTVSNVVRNDCAGILPTLGCSATDSSPLLARW